MNINEQAPAKSARELQIEATREVVWGLLSDINNWPRWNPAVSRARLDGPFAPGSIFRWKSGGSSLVSTIQDVERPTRVAWTGKTFGVAAVHRCEFDSTMNSLLSIGVSPTFRVIAGVRYGSTHSQRPQELQ